MPPAKGAPADYSSNPVAPTQFGRYALIKKLAAGGMAEVFLARQQGMEGFEKLVVLKRILPHLAGDDEFVQMFLNEARIAARFNHANIVQIYDLGKAEGTYFIGMEFIHGEDLGRIMRKAWNAGRWLPMQLSLGIIARACEGLYYAHTKADESGNPLKVVHRDISPQNILVSFDGGVKIVDFGIARAADSSTMTKSGTIKGKYAYMSPEQAQGKTIDARTDVFALGLVLYELLTGVRPLKRESDIQTLQAALACEIDPPSKVASVSDTLDPVVMKALTAKVGDRYQSAREFQLAIEDYLIQNQLAASSVHLSEFMKELFADRLEEEARLGRPAPAGPGSMSSQSLPSIKAYSPQAEIEEVSESQLLPNTNSGVSGPMTAPTEVPEYVDDRPRGRRATGTGTPQARRPSRVDQPAAPPVEDDDDEPTSLDGGDAKPARRTATGSRKAVSEPPRRRTGELPSARGAERSRARSTASTGGMPEAPPRASSTAIPRSEAWKGKEGGKARGPREEESKRPSLLPFVLVVAALAGGGYVFKDKLLELAQGRTAKPATTGGAVAADNAPSLSVDSNVVVNVYVNGELVGETPLSRYLLKPGPVRIRLVNEGMALERQLDLVAHEGDSLNRHEDFAVGKVYVNVDPPQDAEVFLGKARLGKLPGPALTLGEGKHELLVKSIPPGRTAKVEVSVPKGLTRTVQVRLSKSDTDSD